MVPVRFLESIHVPGRVKDPLTAKLMPATNSTVVVLTTTGTPDRENSRFSHYELTFHEFKMEPAGCAPKVAIRGNAEPHPRVSANPVRAWGERHGTP